MFFFNCSNLTNDNKINISFKSIDAAEFFKILSEKSKKDVVLKLKAPIKFTDLDYKNLTLNEILKNISEKYKLKCEIINNIIYISQEDGYWHLYSLKFFYEDDLPNLYSFFNSDENIKNDTNKISIFWNEIEKNIKVISKDNYSIDKYNGFISVFGNKTTHDQLSNYFDKIQEQLYKQVLS